MIRHPQADETPRALLDEVTWSACFHVIQLVLVGSVALSGPGSRHDFGRTNTWLARLRVGVFLVFFSGYDAVAGIAGITTGIAMRSARDLLTGEQGLVRVGEPAAATWV